MSSRVERAKAADSDLLDGKDSTAFEQVANKDQANGYAGLDVNGLLSKADCVTSANVGDDVIQSEHLGYQSGFNNDSYDPPSQSYAPGRTTIRTWTLSAQTAGVILRVVLATGDAVNALRLFLQIQDRDGDWFDFFAGSATSQTTFQIGDVPSLTGAFDIRAIRLQVNNPNAGNVTFDFVSSALRVLAVPRTENAFALTGV